MTGHEIEFHNRIGTESSRLTDQEFDDKSTELVRQNFELTEQKPMVTSIDEFGAITMSLSGNCGEFNEGGEDNNSKEPATRNSNNLLSQIYSKSHDRRTDKSDDILNAYLQHRDNTSPEPREE